MLAHEVKIILVAGLSVAPHGTVVWHVVPAETVQTQSKPTDVVLNLNAIDRTYVRDKPS